MKRVPLIAKERKRIRQTPSLSVADLHLFGPWFKRKSTWTAWFAVHGRVVRAADVA
jgi:hypothetical protein